MMYAAIDKADHKIQTNKLCNEALNDILSKTDIKDESLKEALVLLAERIALLETLEKDDDPGACLGG